MAKTEINRNPLDSGWPFPFFAGVVGQMPQSARVSPSHWPKSISSKHLQVILSYQIAAHAMLSAS